jgi:hypothetical protein
MRRLAVKRTGNRVAFGDDRSASGAAPLRLSSFIALSPKANAIATAFSASVTDRYWMLEYSKIVAAEGFAVLGQAREIAERTSAGEGELLFTGIIDPARVRIASAHMMTAKDCRVAGAGGRRRIFAVRYWLSALVAVAAYVWTLLRSGWGNRLTAAAEKACVIAVHGETSNRTRHVLAAAAEDDIAGIIVLGRPGASLAGLSAQWSSEFGLDAVPLCRAIGIGAALASVPTLLRRLGAGRSIAARSGFVANWADEIAVLYRMCLGTCSFAWWNAQAATPRIVIYGQTGLADTSLLEAAQQGRGTETVHWVHGLSGGWNFAGFSDLGLFKCGHDAEMHERLPAYRRTEYLPQPKAELRSGSDGQWLLMTNYAHPSNPYFPNGGYELEMATLRIAAEAARQTDVGAENVIWRPHPVFWSLPEPVRARICAAAGEYGLAVPEAGGEAPPLDGFQALICTPSTVAVEALARGILPVIVAPHEIADDSVYRAFPLRAAGTDALVDAVRRLGDGSSGSALFGQVWAQVRPGAQTITIAEIERLAAG